MIRAAVVAGFVLAAVAMRVVLAHVPSAYDVDRAQPLTVVTYWQTGGLWMCGALLTGVAVAAVGYIRCLQMPQRPLVLSAVACIAALCVPAIFSSDVYAYAAYGQMIAHGINPYAHTRIALHDPLLDAAQWQWGNPLPVCVYGPLFLAIARIAVLAAPFSAAAPLWILRIAACAALVACGALAVRAYWWLPHNDRVRAACIIALNPAAIWACAEGHNDVFAIACALAGLALVRRSPFWGAVVAGAAGAIKAPAIAASFATWRASRFGSLAGIALAAIASLPLLYAATHDVAPHGTFAPHFSPVFFLSLFMLPSAAIAVTGCCALATVAAGRARTAYLVLALLMLVPNPYPWYGMWLLPVAAALRSRGEQAALIAASLLLLLRYFGETTSLLWPVSESAIAIATFGIPAAMLAGSGLLHRRRPEIRTAVPDLARPRLP